MNIQNLDTPERKAKRELQKKEGFMTFMSNPLVKAMISMQPGNEHMEAILQACFNQGFDAGGGAAAIELAEILIKKQNGGR